MGALRCTDLYLTGTTGKTLRIDWDYSPLGGLANPVYEVRRRLGLTGA